VLAPDCIILDLLFYLYGSLPLLKKKTVLLAEAYFVFHTFLYWF